STGTGANAAAPIPWHPSSHRKCQGAGDSPPASHRAARPRCGWRQLTSPCRLRTPGRAPQGEGRRRFDAALLPRDVIDHGRRMAVILEAGAAPRFRLVGVDWEGFIIAAAWVRHVIDAATERATAPGIDDVEGQRRMDVEDRVQCGRQLPGLETHTGDELTG